MSLDLYLIMKIDTGSPEMFRVVLWEGNYTHNVTPMWSLSGVYEALYMSKDKLAGSVIKDLEHGLDLMKCSPDEFKRLNPANGWGNYEGAVKFLEGFLVACKLHPKSTIELWK
jgi:hypothetical protein